MKIFWKQFWGNMLLGIFFSAIWFYVFYKLFEGFWLPTICTNLVGFFILRYWIFKEGDKI